MPVAPFTGAWIETFSIRSERPMKKMVAPFTGAWIETFTNRCSSNNLCVAPFTGAWIETEKMKELGTDLKSHPSRVRGLKLAPGAQRPGR